MRLLATGYHPPSLWADRLQLPSVLTCSMRHTTQPTKESFWQQKLCHIRNNQVEINVSYRWDSSTCICTRFVGRQEHFAMFMFTVYHNQGFQCKM